MPFTRVWKGSMEKANSWGNGKVNSAVGGSREATSVLAAGSKGRLSERGLDIKWRGEEKKKPGQGSITPNGRPR